MHEAREFICQAPFLEGPPMRLQPTPEFHKAFQPVGSDLLLLFWWGLWVQIAWLGYDFDPI